MTEYTKKLMKDLSFVGSASRRLLGMGMNPVKKKAPAQQRVLDILANEDGLTQGVLAEILDVRPSSLTEILKKLESRGEIERVEDPQDKRIKSVYLTEAGRKKTTPTIQQQDRSEDFFFGLNEEEQRQLDLLLTKIIAGWQEDFGAGCDLPNSPFDSMESFKAMKEQLANEMKNLSPKERNQMKRAAREKMRQEFGRNQGFGRHGGFGPVNPMNPLNPMNPMSDCNDCCPEESEWDNW
ncbi:DNA-binding MarR family transcriptional regulator [Enterococcus sp. PF1-24]|uniref:MarR family winged helix-turn-helix transcriptional regulator n=1 Tax=unclassified Enterococcus TaxID=2608891 RepID=UPI002477164B|nr:MULTISPECIES: MarR family transcriptional regulator [unclassified Enterococcus]MDH6364264.1 DNA-binding MarR family transcriptional regulator [Enterococcus sp. PFB1-1]MDH6401377.1 DNA-binding MarR family transcriptional regulator [Enterococcus sp. PF1-24]